MITSSSDAVTSRHATPPSSVSAGHRVLELFKRRGVTTIANDTVLDIGLTALVLGATAAYLAAAYLLLLLVGSVLGGLGGVLVVAVLVLSWFVVNVIMATTIQVLRSSFRAVFVCFVQVTRSPVCRRPIVVPGGVCRHMRFAVALLSGVFHRRVFQAARAPRRVLDGFVGILSPPFLEEGFACVLFHFLGFFCHSPERGYFCVHPRHTK